MTKPLRQTMPTVATWIDQLRAAFGEEAVNAAIKAGIAGQPTFYAAENGQQVGTLAAHGAENCIALSDTIVGPLNATAARADGRKGKN